MARRFILIGGLLGLVAAAFIFHLLPTRKVSSANFETLQIGMSFDDVEALLGPMVMTHSVTGRIENPTTFATNNNAEIQRKDNHRAYQYCHWESSELIIVALFDDGKLVCRYCAEPSDAWYIDLFKQALRKIGL